jgi:glycine/D-amino acid oxidase-like deaminating enzyme
MISIDSVATSDQLPSRVDVCIVGGGIIGISTALELAERGISVAVLEKGIIAGEQSSRNWGWCRQMGRDPREVPLVLESLKLWRGMNARVGAETGYRQCGIMYLAETEEQLAKHEAWHRDVAKPHKLATKLIGPDEIARLQPGGTVNWKGALYTSEDGRAEPFIAVPAMARHLVSLGGHVLQNCAVRGVEFSGDAVSAVVTEKGRVACSQAVLAGGAWSRRFLHNLEISFPQITVLNSVMRTEPIDAGSEITCSGGRVAFRKRLDGGYTVTHNHFSVADIMPDSFRLFFRFLPLLMLDFKGIKLRIGQRFIDEAKLKRRWTMDEASPFEQVRTLDPQPVQSILDDAMAYLKKAYPVFQQARIAESWGGFIDTTPDVVPVISALPQRKGFWLASGFSGHGFGIGPGAGKLMAQLITGETPCVDPAPFRYTRYFDGSNPRPTSGT